MDETKTTVISLTEFKQNFGAIINQVSYGDARFVLASHGKARAALVSLADLQLLEELHAGAYKNRQGQLLAEARQLREAVAAAGYEADSSSLLDEVREERTDDLTNLR